MYKVLVVNPQTKRVAHDLFTLEKPTFAEILEELSKINKEPNFTPSLITIWYEPNKVMK